jgi:hypothetical protein
MGAAGKAERDGVWEQPARPSGTGYVPRPKRLEYGGMIEMVRITGAGRGMYPVLNVWNMAG